MTKNIKLYYHRSADDAEYLFDTFMVCPNGHKEGVINDKTKYSIRLDIARDKPFELLIRD